MDYIIKADVISRCVFLFHRPVLLCYLYHMGHDDENLLTLLGGRKRKSWVNIVFGRTGIVCILILLQILFMLLLFYDFLKRYETVYFTLTSLLSLVFLIIIVNSPSNNSVKLTWFFIISVFPVFGIPLYIYLQMDIGHKAQKHVIAEEQKRALAFRKDDKELKLFVKDRERFLFDLAVYLGRYAGSSVFSNTRTVYHPSGEDAFMQMLRDLEGAQDFIFLEYFIIEEGVMFGRILRILADKVRQGVEVRLIYDGLNALARVPYSYYKKLEAIGIHCRVFSPFTPFVSTHYNNRDHRKILVIDNCIAYTGGINLADEYINRRNMFGIWKDTCLRMEGEAVSAMTVAFLSIWNSIGRGDGYSRFLRPCRPVEDEGYVIPYTDSPLDDERVGESVYQDILGSSCSYCWIMTPYLILDGEMLSSLTRAAKRGVDVRIILPHVPDKKYAFALAKTHYRELLSSGVSIYEYTPGFVHSKLFLADDRVATVGTVNLDYRSLYLHFENGVVIYKKSSIREIRTDFEKTFSVSRRIDPETWRPGVLEGICGSLLKFVAPLL